MKLERATQLQNELNRVCNNADAVAGEVYGTLQHMSIELSHKIRAAVSSRGVMGLPRQKNLNDYAQECHEANIKWWQDIETGERIERNQGELLMLMVSEIAEAMEGLRKGLMDNKLPHRKAVEVELADLFIRLGDFCSAYGIDLEGAYQEKMEYNRTREDHTHEHRRGEGGKKF